MTLNLVSRILRLTSGQWLFLFLSPLLGYLWRQNVPTRLREELLRAGLPCSEHFSVSSHHSLTGCFQFDSGGVRHGDGGRAGAEYRSACDGAVLSNIWGYHSSNRCVLPSFLLST